MVLERLVVERDLYFMTPLSRRHSAGYPSRRAKITLLKRS